MDKKIIYIIGVTVIVLAGGFFFWQYTAKTSEEALVQESTNDQESLVVAENRNNQKEEITTTTDKNKETADISDDIINDTTKTSTTTSDQAKSYTLTEIKAHNSASSCWTIIDGGVYNLTSWISQHPGGEQAILSLCGKDGTTAFRNQHDHAPQQMEILATFKIGIAKN